MGIFRPNDFSLYRILLELVSFESIHKIAMVDTATSEDKAIISLSLLFLRLFLYVVNGKQVPAIHRAVYVWSAALLLTSLSGLSEIKKEHHGISCSFCFTLSNEIYQQAWIGYQ